MSCSVAAGEFYWFCLEKVTCSAGVSGRLRWEEVGISTDFYSFFGAVPGSATYFGAGVRFG